MGRWVACVGEKFMICMHVVYIKQHTSLSRRKKEEISRLCRPCFCGWVKKLYRCLYSGAHSFDTRFSHAGLASLFITNFRVQIYVYILSFFFRQFDIKKEKSQNKTFSHTQKFLVLFRVDTISSRNFCRPRMPIFNRHPVSLV